VRFTSRSKTERHRTRSQRKANTNDTTGLSTWKLHLHRSKNTEVPIYINGSGCPTTNCSASE